MGFRPVWPFDDTGNMAVTHLAVQSICILSWLLALGWLWQAIAALRGMPTLTDLARIDSTSLPPLPANDDAHLTVIVPACNEERSIQATLRSLLTSTGLHLEIIAVNDRSTDRTGQLMDEIASDTTAEGRHRLHVIHLRELPAGWLGKPHAMAVAARRATSPWLLFTDGDIVFHPRALELGLRYALARNADHLVMAPTLILKTVGEAAVLAAADGLAEWVIRLWKVSDPHARDFVGVGSFNLVRREIYERVGGFEVLRMEVVDDLRFGWLIKRAGYLQCVATGPGLVRVRWLHGALSIFHLVEKNAFAVYRFRLGLSLLVCLGLVVQVILPLAAIATGGWAAVAGLLIFASIALSYHANRRVTGVSPWVAAFFTLAVAIVLVALMRSIVLALVRRGVVWRGTFYPLAELRRHAGIGWTVRTTSKDGPPGRVNS